MSDRYPRCAKCGHPLSVRAGIKKGGLVFCNIDCENSYYGPAQTQWGQAESIIYGSLETLRAQNPHLSEKSLLTLHYLGWEAIPPKDSEDYKVFRKVRSWVE